MRDQFLEFLQNPGRDTFLVVRAAVASSDHYSPYSMELNGIESLLDAGQFAEARQKIAAGMPNLLLSPRAHLMLAWIAEKTGDEQVSQMERHIAAACVEGILSTGDGTRESPRLVLRTSDEYDVLQYLGKKMAQQALVESGDRRFDRLTCEGGEELWFDITEPFSRLSRSFGGH